MRRVKVDGDIQIHFLFYVAMMDQGKQILQNCYLATTVIPDPTDHINICFQMVGLFESISGPPEARPIL